MAKSRSSRRWLQEHENDQFVKKARIEGYRSRAAYKLLEIQDKDKLIKPGMNVVDLGAAPGGWSQVVAELLKAKGQIIALDILPMPTLAEVSFIQGDFRDEQVLQELLVLVNNQPIDLVVSDMAPNMSGNKSVDQPSMMYLAELALEFAQQVLKPQGCLLVKVFQGEGFQEYLTVLRANFKQVVTRKPTASRDRSAELYLLAKGYRGRN